MSRRVASLLMALCLALPLAAGAQAVLNDEGGRPLSLGSQCLYGDQLLIWTGRALYGWRTEEAAPRLIAPQPEGLVFHQLVSGGGRLYGLDLNEWLLWPLTLQGAALSAGEPVRLRADLLEDPRNAGLLPLTALVLGDRLYALLQPDGLGGWESEVYAFDLDGGEGGRLDLPHPQWIAQGPAGSLLLLSHDHRGASATADGADDFPEALTLDPAGLQVLSRTTLGQPFAQGTSLPLVLWDEGAGELCYTAKDVLYRRGADGREAVVARLPAVDSHAGSGQPVLMMPDGTLALASRGRPMAFSPEAQAQSVGQSPLIIYGLYDRGQHEKVMTALPGLAAQPMEWMDPADLGRMLAGGSGEADVLFLRSDQDEIGRFIAKGYLMDLSSSDAIRGHLARCYPMIAQSARTEGGLWLLPVALDSMLFTHRPQLFEELDMTPPRTFGELADLLQAWADGGAERWPQYLPLASGTPRRDMLTEAVREAFLQQAMRGEDLRFDDPLLRGLLERAQALRLTPLELQEDDYSFMDRPALISRTNLSLGSMSVSVGFGPGEEVLPLMISPGEGLPAVLPVQIGYLGIYAGSRNPQAALRYLEAWLGALEHENRVKLCPGFDEPVQLPGIDQIVARYDEQIARLDREIASAQGAQRTELERLREEAVRTRDEQELMRWHLSPDVIARYRALMEHAVIATRGLDILWHAPEFRDLVTRLGQGQLSLDAFLEEAQGKLRLMQLEGQ